MPRELQNRKGNDDFAKCDCRSFEMSLGYYRLFLVTSDNLGFEMVSMPFLRLLQARWQGGLQWYQGPSSHDRTLMPDARIVRRLDSEIKQ